MPRILSSRAACSPAFKPIRTTHATWRLRHRNAGWRHKENPVKALRLLVIPLALALLVGACSDDPDENGSFDGPAVYVDAVKGSAAGAGTFDDPVNTLEAAIKLAKAGDTLVLSAGTFSESVALPADVHIKGEGSGKTVIKPPKDGSGITLGKDGVDIKIEGVAITEAWGYGISAPVVGLTLVDVKVEKTKMKTGSPGTGHGIQVIGAAKLKMENCNVTMSAGTGVIAQKVASVSIVDPAYSVSPRGGSGSQSIVDPAYSPASSIAGNFGGGIAIVDPAYSPGGKGKSDSSAEHFVIKSTIIKDNRMYGLAVYGGSGTVFNSAITGTQKHSSQDFADGLVLSDGSDPDLQGAIKIAGNAVIGGNQRTGLLLSTPAIVDVDGEIRGNIHGGLWARGDKALIRLSSEARVTENKMVGAAVTWGARLEANGARIEKTQLAAFGNPGGGIPVQIGDGVGVFDKSHAKMDGATLEGNARAGVVAHGSAANKSGQVDIQISGTKFIGGEFGIVVNKQKAGATPASVPTAEYTKNNSFDGQKTKVEPAGNLDVQVSPCGVNKPAETKCIPPIAK